MKKLFSAIALSCLCSCSADSKSNENNAYNTSSEKITEATDKISLFDGETLNGWSINSGDEAFWNVKNGEIIGGSLEKDVPRNVWLVSDISAENFELTFSVKFTGSEDNKQKNSGIQVRSLHEHGNVIGYQIDIGPTHPQRSINDGFGYWGNIWDEHRRGPLYTAINQDQLKESVSQEGGWNDYKIICEGPHIKTWINGILANDYTEENPRIAADGIFALQTHKGGKCLFHFKDIYLKELAPTEGSPKWTDENIIKTDVRKKNKPKSKKKKGTV